MSGAKIATQKVLCLLCALDQAVLNADTDAALQLAAGSAQLLSAPDAQPTQQADLLASVDTAVGLAPSDVPPTSAMSARGNDPPHWL